MDRNGGSQGPLYYESGSWKKLFLRGWFLVTILAVIIAFILGLVKAKDDAVMYLLVVNLLMSGVIGATIAWWFHKGNIGAQSLVFILFVGMCIVFQAIVSDIYLYHNPNTGASSPEDVITNASSIISPTMSSTYKVVNHMTQAL